MSVYIKGMEMPKDGVYWCEIGVADDIAMITIHGEDRKSFSLVPVHEPHGRLGDLDKLNKEMHLLIKENMFSRDDARDLLETIADAPTVIPASGTEVE